MIAAKPYESQPKEGREGITLTGLYHAHHHAAHCSTHTHCLATHLSTTIESQVVSAMTMPNVARHRNPASVGAHGRCE
jgi:hypothetical protein